ncbi:dihydroneopterin aldolase [Ichthyobacterium seriolicida]|uniref:7,8-dihydroneopterin aldolase n=1 Tax=Ichthyobacterium seriolicida TaxID=242600 RepID=A0A1J1DYW3_9FLAO|nr:dihydroneopterin aldolase [Ichthyobacterium seriolicida]BAV95089.1 dihydroneopterin aldolase [Ichthyobacterium seriolicida]
MNIIHIEGIKVYAFHGVMEEEKKIGSYYKVDIKLFLDLQRAAISDDLSDTINYSQVNDLVLEQMKISSDLLENLTHRINLTIKENFEKVSSVETKVTKINPPMNNGEVKQVSVIIKS